ncbi:FASTK kinase, partial [Nyctiprogne leucopyga]|nr:FASTK kinase [Nyctiprogne leucopyga]
MKRLIERSRSAGEVLRWVTQNPGKVCASHYPIALHKLGQLLQQHPGQPVGNGDARGASTHVLEQPEFQTLCQAIVSGCSKFDNFSIVNCLYAAAALGLPGESPLVRVLEDESRGRLGRFNQKDVSMVFSSEANNKALEAIFSSQLFYENRQERFIRSMAEWLPRKAENLTPYPPPLIAKYVARHRLREPRLPPTIASFLLKRGEQLDSKVIQKLVFPFSRMNYRPSNHSELFPKLEAILEQKAGTSPLATVNILMSMFQLSHFPQAVLHQVFSPAFITNVMRPDNPLGEERAVSVAMSGGAFLLRELQGVPSLPQNSRAQSWGLLMPQNSLVGKDHHDHRVQLYKGLVAEALRQLVGEECYRQDEVLPPGYCTDFLLWINRSGTVLPLSRVPAASKAPSALPPSSPAAISLRSSVLALTSDLQVVLSVNDKWHYCQNSDILVGSRAMRDRHLRLLGYCLVQV